jgi:hypothetical protein
MQSKPTTKDKQLPQDQTAATKAKVLRARARKVRLRRLRLRAKYTPRAEVAREVERLIAEASGMLARIPAALAPRLEFQELAAIDQTFEAFIRHTLTEFAAGRDPFPENPQ